MPSMTSLQQLFKQAFPDSEALFDEPLAHHTYCKIGGPAEIFCTITTEQALLATLQFCTQHTVPLTILGGGSNVIVADTGVRGMVLHLANRTITATDTTVIAGAGAKTALVVKAATEAKLTGLEYFLGVPGTIGGAVFNNAHYLTDLIGQTIQSVRVFDRTGTSQQLSHQDCQFAYEYSIFQETQEIVWEVNFALQPSTAPAIREKIQKAALYRAQTQPLGEPSSGCIFQNVPNTPELTQTFPELAGKKMVGAGFLIDRAGLKGSRVGGIEVSHKHAAFFINTGQGTAAQVEELVRQVQDTVKTKFGVSLQKEVFLL